MAATAMTPKRTCTSNEVTPTSLRVQGNQILSGLSLDEYKSTLKMVERAILATDLALYMK